jgi:ABC-type nitrate/sulfonate/bicarbonate transport system substrate-binding protein
VALGLCAGLQGAPVERVTLQLKGRHQFEFAGYYAAQEKGYFRDAGLDVTLLEAPPNLDPIQEVTEGRAEYGVGNSGLLLARQAGLPVVVLAALFQHSPMVFIARAEAEISSIHALAGRRVMLERHAEELLACLKKEGVPTSLDLLGQSFDSEALVQGKVDAISAYSSDEPFLLERSGFPYQAFTPRSAGIDFYGDNLFTTETELRTHPARVKAFRAASLRGWKYALQHSEEMADLILAHHGPRHSRDHLLFEARQLETLVQPLLVELGYMHEGR